MGDWMDFSPSTWANVGAGALQANYGCRWTTVGHTMFVTFYIVVYTDSYPNWIYLSIPNGWTAATNVATAGACAGATGGFAGGSAAFSIQVMPGANYMQLGRVLDGGQVWNPPGNVTLAGSIAFSIN
jgi:hypothetical protein